jgi:hypothetical protein
MSFVIGLWMSQAHANTYTVTTTADSGAGSLRLAMTDANTHAGLDTIVFNVPTTDAGFTAVPGVWTIRPTTPLPKMTDGGTVIDGTTQSANQGNRNPFGPEIEIDGTNAADANGLFITSPNNVIQGLIINRAAWTAIEIQGTPARGNIIVGNYIGTDATGMVAQGNHVGGIWIRAGASNARIGGQTVADRNIISGTTTSMNLATGNGVYIDKADSNRIIGNYIGVNREGTDTLPNSIVEIFSVSSDEGATYEGTVTADPSGNFLWSGTASGPHVTATCTDTAGNTPEFSVHAPVTGAAEQLRSEAPAHPQPELSQSLQPIHHNPLRLAAQDNRSTDSIHRTRAASGSTLQ